MIDTKSRLLAVVGALLLLFVVVDLVRRRKLKEEYSVLWVAAALTLLLLAVWYQLLGWITTAIGGVALSSTLFFFALLFIFFVLLHYSVRISTLERRLTALVQESALSVLARPRPPAEPVSPAAAAPRIAVIVPCFNDGELVPQALNSIAEDEPVEVVVVDDGSTEPRTLEALADLASRGVRVVRRENGGLGAARMTGLASTGAAFVYPLDSDDRLKPGALGEMADALELAPRAAFAWGDYEIFGGGRGRYRSPERWLPWTLTYVNPYPVSSMFRRATLEASGGWQGRAYEDWDLWLRLAGMGLSGVRVDRVVYRRRLHESPRLLTDARKRHGELYSELQRRNDGVFARREHLRLEERPAAWKRAAYPIVFGARSVVPMSVEAFLQRAMMRLGTGLPG